MVDSGYIVPTGNLVVKGRPTNVVYRNLGVATNAYPGRLVVREATDYDVKVSDGIGEPQGWIGFEQQAIQYQVESKTTINVVDTEVPVISGGGFTIYMPSGLAAGTVAAQEDPLISWDSGQVLPGVEFEGKYAIKIPFTKNTSETATGITLPAGSTVKDVIINCVTNASSATIDVGTLSSASGDADGFLDGESLGTAGIVTHNTVDATAANITVGDLLEEVEIKDATGTPVYYGVPISYVVPAGGKQISYTTSNHTVAGYIYVFVDSPGVKKVGTSGTAVDASAAAAGVFVKTCI